ncbi:MAG TPA: hypothetical protein VHO90_13595, partial [Bacteroidales bacterium]|nr:hypothetical protein [Bacteroidales bacterium]
MATNTKNNPQNLTLRLQDDNELQKIVEQVLRKYYYFVIGIILALIVATGINFYSTPIYRVSTSIRIIDNDMKQPMGDFVSSSLFGTGNMQNELLMLKSSPIISKTITNLDLPVDYFVRERFKYIDAYKKVPFKVLYMQSHSQPVGALFKITFGKNNTFNIEAKSKRVGFFNYEKNSYTIEKEDWKFKHSGKIGELIETSDLSFIIALDSLRLNYLHDNKEYFFSFNDVPTLTEILRNQIQFNIVEMKANVIKISMRTSSLPKGIDILNSITDVYSKMNLEKKNHLADITVDYIDKQLGEIADSLS